MDNPSSNLNRAKQTFAVLVLALLANAAAAGGGLDAGTQAANNFNIWLYGFLGTCAATYLMYLGGMAKAGKKTWGDFGMGIGHVAAVGGSVGLAKWGWSLFAN